jgi:hypothetical protein
MPNTARGLPRECHPCQSVQDRDADAIGSVPSWRWPRLARTKRSRVPRFSYSATFGPSCSLILPAMNMTRGKRRGRNTLTSQSPGLTLALASMRVVVVDLRNHIVSGNASSRRRLHHFYRLNGASMTTHSRTVLPALLSTMPSCFRTPIGSAARGAEPLLRTVCRNVVIGSGV